MRRAMKGSVLLFALASLAFIAGMLAAPGALAAETPATEEKAAPEAPAKTEEPAKEPIKEPAPQECRSLEESEGDLTPAAGMGKPPGGSKCCNPDDEPGTNGNPLCFEGHTCCSDGRWSCNNADGSPSCEAGEVCAAGCGNKGDACASGADCCSGVCKPNGTCR